MSLAAARTCFDALNRDYAAVHQAKEELFWATYMGLSQDDAGFAKAEQAFKDFISEPGRLREVREHLAALATLPAGEERDALVHGLTGWQATFEANIVEGDEARSLMHAIVQAEADLFARRRGYAPKHLNEKGEEEDASLAGLATNLTTNPVEGYRRSSFEAMRGIEQWVLSNGFLEIVDLRNRYARALGFSDYFEFKLRKNERMSRAQLLGLMDDFLARTDAANTRAMAVRRAVHGDAVSSPWNLRYMAIGDVTRRMDEYLSFASALRRWVKSFRRLHIGFRGATMQLDLVERPGKFDNGFCHSPVPAWVNERGEWIPGHINFTSVAKPDQVGSGSRAIMTLFHEGGHAAHFANVVQNAPCFSQEYAPTSMAYAETQSMFCDSLLDDADWLKTYALNRHGDPMPDDVIRDHIASRQGYRTVETRSLAVVPYFESTLYAMADAERTPARVLQLARETEVRVMGFEHPRPTLAIPHLLNQESAASYQGYLLAEMAVAQTRAFFLERDGFLTDNPAIGPELSRYYWAPGNSVTHNETLRSLTGEGFSASYLAEDVNLSADEVWTAAQTMMSIAAESPDTADEAPSLDATIRVVHGAELIADSSQGEDAMCDRFEAWVAARYPTA